MMLLHIFNDLDGLNFYHSLVTVLAQQTNVDLLGDFQRSWNNIVRTGQLAAFFVGLVVGWGLKSLLP